MPATDPTPAEPSRQEPFRWPRAEIAPALDNFSDLDPRSQREAAQRLGIPHATFNYWTRHYCPADADPVDSFFRSAAGEQVLRRILTAALVVFQRASSTATSSRKTCCWSAAVSRLPTSVWPGS